MQPESRHFELEAPDGFVVRVLDALPEHMQVGESLSVDDELWQQWVDYWAEGPPAITVDWFEMADVKKHAFRNKVWIPLYADEKIKEAGRSGYVGFREEYFGARTLIVPNDQKEGALGLSWTHLTAGFGAKPWVDENKTFHSASEFYWDDVTGSLPALLQYTEVEQSRDLYVNQDIVLGLGLKRVDDHWVRPEEDYLEVLRLLRDSDSRPVRLEIKAEFLKDYLCAAKSGLILLTYRSRNAIDEPFEEFQQEQEEFKGESVSYEWNGHIRDRFEGDSLLDIFGEARVFHAWRTDTDYEEDIPSYEFPGATDGRSYDVKSSSRKISQATGEIWKKEWIDGADSSPRVRGDESPSTLEFIVDNAGSKKTSAALEGSISWLWFHPEVINALLKKPNSVLNWYSEDTGNVGGAWNRSVHFGVNAIGLINVFAKDIALLREIDKKTWAHYNVSPDGKVSPELLMSQMQADPAATEAPEATFFRLVEEIQEVSRRKFGRELIKRHASSEDISKEIHRFHATSLEGFYSLCKEITRFLIERIDIDLLKKIKTETDSLGSLKRLQHILTALGFDGRKLMGVFVGVYELRLADAHLPSSTDIEDAMALVGVDYDVEELGAGKLLLQNLNNALADLKNALETGDVTKPA